MKNIKGLSEITDPKAIVIINRLYDRIQSLKKKLTHDTLLTNVYNRRGLFQMSRYVRHHSRRYGETLTVAFIDLDKFKVVNDKLSHDIGDELLKIVARVLIQTFRDIDIVARWGGDEFVCILTGVDRKEYEEIKERLNVNLLIALNSKLPKAIKLGFGWSIGMVTWRELSTLSDTIKRADYLMYLQKKEKRAAR